MSIKIIREALVQGQDVYRPLIFTDEMMKQLVGISDIDIMFMRPDAICVSRYPDETTTIPINIPDGKLQLAETWCLARNLDDKYLKNIDVSAGMWNVHSFCELDIEVAILVKRDLDFSDDQQENERISKGFQLSRKIEFAPRGSVLSIIPEWMIDSESIAMIREINEEHLKRIDSGDLHPVAEHSGGVHLSLGRGRGFSLYMFYHDSDPDRVGRIAIVF